MQDVGSAGEKILRCAQDDIKDVSIWTKNALAPMTINKCAVGSENASVDGDAGHLTGDAAKHQILGKSLFDQLRIEEAVAAFEQARPLETIPALADYHVGLCRLLQGCYREAWPLFEGRLEVPRFARPVVDVPTWTPDCGATRILVTAEQGFGDMIQFSRLLPRFQQHTRAEVCFWCPQPLLPLYAAWNGPAGAGGGLSALSKVSADRFQAALPIMSLAAVLDLEVEDLPGPMPALCVSPDRIAHWRARRPAARKVYGLCWAGRSSHPQDAQRSMPPAALLRLQELQGHAWVGLQRPPNGSPAPGGLLDHDWGAGITDFGELAAMLMSLDGLVTVDTAHAHLAGTLGVPTLLLLPYAPDWRWLLDRADSPWYPSLRLIRQRVPGDWSGVVDQLISTLGVHEMATKNSKAAAVTPRPAPESKTSEPRLEIDVSRQFTSWLREQKLSLAFTTYQAGKLFFVGLKPDASLWLHERTFERCMGLAVSGDSLYMANLMQLWRFNNVLEAAQFTPDGADRLYVPQVSWVTGDIDAHDVAVDAEGRLIFVNTLFSCLATPDPAASFRPVWQPSFISKLAAEDRCHLNGLAMKDGQPAYVTAVATTDVHEGWREHRRSGGVVIDVASGEVVCRGLSMPHSPRWHQDRLWVLNSGTGEFGHVDLAAGRFVPLCFLPGYARGLAFHGQFAVIGLSKPRKVKTFDGLELQERLEQKQVSARCGLVVVDLRTGDQVHSLMADGVVEELYDVAVLPGVRTPAALGFKTDEIRRTIKIGT